jgi:hypothetical protein
MKKNVFYTSHDEVDSVCLSVKDKADSKAVLGVSDTEGVNDEVDDSVVQGCADAKLLKCCKSCGIRSWSRSVSPARSHIPCLY